MRWLGVMVAALALSACAFSSEDAFFDDDDGVHLFGAGETVTWRERPDGETRQVRFEHVMRRYDFAPVDGDDAPMRVLFVPIRDTPEEDYYAQVDLSQDGSRGVAYAFVWRTGRTYRVILDPRTQDQAAAAQYCRAAGAGECQFERVADLRGYYRALIYPVFVRGERLPASYLDLELPFPDDGAGRPDKPR